MKRFEAPNQSLGVVNADSLADLVLASSDLALLVDAKGVIRDVSVGNADLAAEGCEAWIGKPWASVVTTESVPKINEMLTEAAAGGASRSRHVNHLGARSTDLPIQFTAMAIGSKKRVLALGRDLRTTAGLQRRLVDAQQSMEREYARLNHAELRYRVLFQSTGEALLIVDANTLRVVEANPAGIRMLASGTGSLVGRDVVEGFDERDAKTIQALLGAVRATGRTDQAVARWTRADRQFRVSATLFRQDATALFLLRFGPALAVAGEAAIAAEQSPWGDVIESLPDGLAITGADGRIIAANRAFLDLVQLATLEQGVGQSLDRWLGRPGVDLGVMISNLRQHAVLKLFATSLRGEFGASTEVEISAAAVAAASETRYGFVARGVARRLSVDRGPSASPTRSIEQLTELIGRIPLKEIVRESSDVIERLCIEAALRLTQDNRASAAEMLGLSRQSLYVKMRRFGLGDLDAALPD